jgi:hypothetical protein
MVENIVLQQRLNQLVISKLYFKYSQLTDICFYTCFILYLSVQILIIYNGYNNHTSIKEKISRQKEGLNNLRITQNRRSTYISLGIKRAERFWNINGDTPVNYLTAHNNKNKLLLIFLLGNLNKSGV